MWTKDYSIRLSVFFTRLFLVLLAAGLFLAPQVVGWFIESESRQKLTAPSGGEAVPFRFSLLQDALPSAGRFPRQTGGAVLHWEHPAANAV